MSGRNYPADTQKQKFLEETYHKERDARILWWYTKQLSQDSGGAEKSKQYQVFRKRIEKQNLGDVNLPQIREPKNYHKKKNDVNESFPQPTSSKLSEAAMKGEMRPVSLRKKKVLYNGFSKEGTGRYQYLQDRARVIPEKKYYFPITTNCGYGWRLCDVINTSDIKKPAHGRTRIVDETFYTRTGIPTLQQQQEQVNIIM